MAQEKLWPRSGALSWVLSSEAGLDKWTNPDNGNQYRVKPTHTYQNTQKQPCREYVTEAIIGGKQEKVYGKACRQTDGSWKVAS
ncbi:MAG: RT0821/Lpp0805 family surface protein [Legionellales bacterium]|nr:RT0821/Lpp0805 family surface protein [Legionellales bacterium]